MSPPSAGEFAVPDWFKPTACPGCRTPFASEYWTHPKVPCQACGKWELHTGVGWSPTARYDSTGSSISSWKIHPPRWHPLLPQRATVPPSGHTAPFTESAVFLESDPEEQAKRVQESSIVTPIEIVEPASEELLEIAGAGQDRSSGARVDDEGGGEAPPTGPVEPNAFRCHGKTIVGFTVRQMRLLRLLWDDGKMPPIPIKKLAKDYAAGEVREDKEDALVKAVGRLERHFVKKSETRVKIARASGTFQLKL